MLRIEKVFKDKNTGELYQVGQIIEVSEARAKELLADARGLVSEVKENAKSAPKSTSKTTAKKSTKAKK